MVFLITAARLAHVASLLRRFGFEVRELCGIPTPVQISDRDRCEVQLVIVDESLCAEAEVDPLAWLGGVLSASSILIVPQPASHALTRRPTPSQRCRYLAPSFSPIDLTLAIAELFGQRKRGAN